MSVEKIQQYLPNAVIRTIHDHRISFDFVDANNKRSFRFYYDTRTENVIVNIGVPMKETVLCHISNFNDLVEYSILSGKATDVNCLWRLADKEFNDFN